MADVFTATIDALSWFFRILWAVRVSVLYALAGCLLFYGAIPAQNLMADLSSFINPWSEFFFWAGVFFFTFLAWAFPIHYGARRTLNEDSWIVPAHQRELMSPACLRVAIADVRHRYERTIDLVPRLLGLAPFLAFYLGLTGALDALANAGALHETMATRCQAIWLIRVDIATAFIFALFVFLRRKVLNLFGLSLNYLHPIALVLTSSLFVAFYVAPIWSSIHLPRALLVPPLLGSLVLFFSLLQRWGNRTGVPMLLITLSMLGILTGLNRTFNDIRTLPTTADQRLTVANALAKWKSATCETGSCPRPIVLAIDGGASRAAFTAATFVGDMMDHMGSDGAPGRMIFAISGVSGGAYGAAVIQAAIRDGQLTAGGKAPCRSAQSTWFGFKAWKEKGGGLFSWRECLQALTSGDYLSATVGSLAFRDFFAPPWQSIPFLPQHPMEDRAGLLEIVWERQYAATLAPGQPFFEKDSSCDSIDSTQEGQGLCRRAAHPTAFIDGHRWMPMLLLNATSVSTGRRVISSDFISPKAGLGAVTLWPEAYDLREAMGKICPTPPLKIENPTSGVIAHLQEAGAAGKSERGLNLGVCGVPAPVVGPDVRLSTAALTSARFPIVSPAGAFIAMKPYGDEVVDGGYFENSGLTTALDLVEAMKAAKVPGVPDPVLVSIANDPETTALTDAQVRGCDATGKPTDRDCTGLPRRPSTTPLVLTADTSLTGRIFGFLSRPLQTILSTRDGHAAEALGRAQAELKPDNSFFRLKVDVTPVFASAFGAACAKFAGTSFTMPKVSMSWWLAASVQENLDAQRCSRDNSEAMRELLIAVNGGIAPPQ